MGNGSQRIGKTQPIVRILEPMLESPADWWPGVDLQRRSGVSTGSLYPILLRLEALGWLTSQWELPDASQGDRPRRRLYRMTSVGRREAIDTSTCINRGVFA